MPYIKRDDNGRIVALLNQAQPDCTEQLPSHHKEVAEFLANEENSSVLKALENSDREIARVTEDLIYLLVSKQIILFTELPMPVQKKLLAREKLRSELPGNDVSFLDDEETI